MALEAVPSANRHSLYIKELQRGATSSRICEHRRACSAAILVAAVIPSPAQFIVVLRYSRHALITRLRLRSLLGARGLGRYKQKCHTLTDVISATTRVFLGHASHRSRRVSRKKWRPSTVSLMVVAQGVDDQVVRGSRKQAKCFSTKWVSHQAFLHLQFVS